MNKQEFIQYIAKLPDDLQFTPMDVVVHADCPNKDGTYRTITKKIKFECDYTEMVHKLPINVFPPASSIDIPIPKEYRFQSITDLLKKVGVIEDNDEIDDFTISANNLSNAIIKSLTPHYGKSLKEWGEVPIFVFANLLFDCLTPKDIYSVNYSCELSNKTHHALNKLADFI